MNYFFYKLRVFKKKKIPPSISYITIKKPHRTPLYPRGCPTRRHRWSLWTRLWSWSFVSVCRRLHCAGPGAPLCPGSSTSPSVVPPASRTFRQWWRRRNRWGWPPPSPRTLRSSPWNQCETRQLFRFSPFFRSFFPSLFLFTPFSHSLSGSPCGTTFACYTWLCHDYVDTFSTTSLYPSWCSLEHSWQAHCHTVQTLDIVASICYWLSSAVDRSGSVRVCWVTRTPCRRRAGRMGHPELEHGDPNKVLKERAQCLTSWMELRR